LAFNGAQDEAEIANTAGDKAVAIVVLAVSLP
jgi:hypothetical protein